MAKIDPANVAPDALPRVRGVVNTRISRGVIIAQAWPKKRGPSKTAEQKFLTQQFSRAATMAANAEPLSAETARFLSKDTVWLPRDLLVRAAYGNLYEVYTPDGTKCYQTNHGYIPSETPEEDQLRQWYDNLSFAWLAGAASGTAQASKGAAFTPSQPSTIYSARSLFAPVAGGTYVMGLYALDASNVITAVQLGTPVTLAGTTKAVYDLPLEALVSAGQKYALLVSRTDGGDTYALPLVSSGNAQWTFPCVDHGQARVAKANPTIGDTVTIASSPFGLSVLMDI